MKNKYLFGYPVQRITSAGIRKYLFFILLLQLLFPMGIAAQTPANITIQMQDKSLLDVMNYIEQHTQYRFYYNSKLQNVQQKVSLSADKEPITSVLANLLTPLGIKYQLKDTDIILADPHSYKATTDQEANTIQGYVKNKKGEPLIGATVIIAGSSRGATTDAKGFFSIKSATPTKLQISYLGYVPQVIPVSQATTVTITLEEEANELDEVVVIGYGSVKKTDVTGSVSNIKMSDIKDAPVLSVDQALQGRIAGADIMSTSGEPGATTSIRIRGTRSISASNEPLIVVDGVMDAIHDLNDINSADIESVSVLKDASSTAIYGSRGSNGVIIITTKKGRELTDKPNITFKADVGFSQLPRKLDIMNASEFAQYRNDYAYYSSIYENVTDGSPLSQYPYKDPLSLGKGTDWMDEITRTASYENYNLSISGKTKKSSYYASLSYNNTQGIIQRSGLQRITGRVNLDRELFKWLKIGYQGSYTTRDQDMNLAEIGGKSYYQAGIYLSPLLDPQTDYNPLYGNGQKINTPRSTIDQNTYDIQRISTNHTIYFDLTLAKGLKLRTQNSYYAYQRHTYRYYPGTLPKKNEGEGGEAYRAEYDEFSLSSENTLNYAMDTKSGHHIDALAGFTAYRFKSNNFTLSGQGYMDDEVMWNNMNAVQDKATYSAASGVSKKVKMSFLARFNYNYKQRYYLTFTGRYDGASNFAADNKWGFFPSGALKWSIANEPFLKDVRWIDELALRVSAGRTGNDAISAYRSLAAMSSTTSGYLFGGSQPAAFYRSRLDSPGLTWEKTDLYNVGIDLELFKSRLNITAEGYISKTRDLLLTVQTPKQTGYESRFTNIGKTSNKGWELSIESRNIVHPKFSWSTNLTFAHNEQTVDDIGTEDFVIASTSAGNNPYMMQGYVKNYPLNALWGFRYGGVWKSVDEFERNTTTHAYASATQISNYKTSLGLPRYYDMNHDGTLNQDDLVYLGNADPYLYGGLQNSFNIGKLKIGVYLTYSLGGKIYNYSELYMSGSFYTNQYRYMLDAWHPVRNPNSNLPRAGAFDTDVPSDRQIHDASYLRLKNASIGYTFDLSRKSRLRDITVSVSGENLWLWKKYNGFDPDVSSSDDDATMRRVDMGAYPKARTIVFSIQLRY